MVWLCVNDLQYKCVNVSVCKCECAFLTMHKFIPNTNIHKFIRTQNGGGIKEIKKASTYYLYFLTDSVLAGK